MTGNCLDNDVTNVPVDGYVRVLSDRQLQQKLNPAIIENTDVLINTQDPTAMYPAERNLQVHGGGNTSQLLPKGITKITELTLDLFDNNYHLYAQKISHSEEGLFIRVILMKNNVIFFNYTYKINGTANVAIATIASADQVCNQYLVHAVKGDTFLCSLGDGHNGVRTSIIRN